MNAHYKLSIITVTKNNSLGLEKTIKSIIPQKVEGVEFIIIDGFSQDDTKAVVQQYESYIDYWISEEDTGIYDAMNKGIRHAHGDYLIFMNSGDCFYSASVIEKLFGEFVKNEFDVYYSDTVFDGRKKFYITASKDKNRIIHQSFVYKRSLHNYVGNYIVFPKITISDYFFFNLLKNYNWKKVGFVISLCDSTGVSQNNRHFYQKLGVDYLFSNKSKLFIVLMSLVFPVYKHIRKITYIISYWGKK